MNSHLIYIIWIQSNSFVFFMQLYSFNYKSKGYVPPYTNNLYAIIWFQVTIPI